MFFVVFILNIFLFYISLKNMGTNKDTSTNKDTGTRAPIRTQAPITTQVPVTTQDQYPFFFFSLTHFR